MSTEVTASQFAVLHGQVWPRETPVVDRDAVAEHLRSAGLVAAVGVDTPAEHGPLGVTLLVAHSLDHEPRVAVLAPSGDVGVGGPAHEALTSLVGAAGVNVELGGVWWDEDDLPGTAAAEHDEFDGFDHDPFEGRAAGELAFDSLPGGGEDEPEDDGYDGEDAPGPGIPGDVLVSRQAESFVPGLARATDSALVAGHADGWTIVDFDEPWLDVTGEGWLPSELPVVHLKRSDEKRRVLEVLTAMTQTESHLLIRVPDLAPVQELDTLAEQVGADVAAALTNPHLAPESPMASVLDSQHFSHVSATELASALQSPMDAHWSARVLTALGLPTLAADVHEERRELDGARMEPLSRGATFVDMMYRSYAAPTHEIESRGFVGRLYGRSTDTPARVGAWLVADVAVAAALAIGFASTENGWVKAVTGLGIAACAADALMQGLWAPRKFRSR